MRYRKAKPQTIAAAILTFAAMSSFVCADAGPDERKAASDLGVLKVGMNAYFKEFGHLPTMDEGLWALMVPGKSADPGRKWPGFLRKMMLDPWGNEYFYERLDREGEFMLRSYGKDGIRSDDDITLLHRPGGS